MGIYSSGVVEGVMIMNGEYKHFEKTYTTQMNQQQIQEVKTYFDVLTEDEKNNVYIAFYTTFYMSCYPSYSSVVETKKGWIPGSRAALEELFHTYGYL